MLWVRILIIELCTAYATVDQASIPEWFDSLMNFETFRKIVPDAPSSGVKGRKLVSVEDLRDWEYDFSGSLDAQGLPHGYGNVTVATTVRTVGLSVTFR